jgi:hypothetical protein
MARHLAIADVGRTLIDLLQAYVTTLNEDEISLASPAESEAKDGTIRIGLYLYDVTENGHSRNDPPVPAEDGTTEPTPHALDLHYLLTAYPPPSNGQITPTARSINQHTLLGRAMQVLHEHAVLRGPDLHDANPDVPPSLSEDKELRLTVEPATSETVTNVWNTFPDVPYQPSVTYLVGPVRVTSDKPVGGRRVEEKTDVYRSITEKGIDG